MAELVGRELEQRALLEVLGRGRHSGVTAWIHGPLGSGKSSLLGWTARVAGGARVVAVACHPADQHRDFSAVHQVVQHLHSHLSDLPDDLAAPLNAVRVGRFDGVAQHVEYALLELLSVAAGPAPLVVTIDDAHWMDDASREAVALVARRVGAEPLTLVVTSLQPPDGTRWTPTSEVPLRVLPADGILPSGSTPARAEADARTVFEQVSPQAQLAVAITALAGSGAGDAAAAIAAAGATAEHLREAVDAGLLDMDGRVTAPLVRVLLATDHPATRHAHDVLADATAGQDPLRSFVHRSQGTATLETEALLQAEALAHDAATEGRTADAVSVMVAAAGHHRDPALVCECYRLAGLFEGSAARYTAAVPWLEKALAAAPTLEWRCIVQRTKSWADMWAGTTAMSAANELARLLDQLPPAEVEMPEQIARAWASLIALYGITDMHASVAAARRAPQHPATDDDRIIAALFSLDHSIAPTLPERPGPLDTATDMFRVPLGMRIEALLMNGEWEAAAAEAQEEVASTRRIGALASLGPAVSRLVMATTFRGDAKGAYGNALATVDIVPDDGSLLASAAYAGAVVGSSRATEWAERCLAIGQRHGITNFVIDAEHALGTVALADDRLDDAAIHLDRCDQLMRDHGFLHPGFAYARGDIAEVAVRRGDLATARRVIAELEVEGFSSAWTMGLASRIRGMVGEAGAFARSLELLAASPWEQARTHLAWARSSTGPERAAQARSAHELFSRHGAVTWAEQARALLADEGVVSPPATADALASLSDRERTVALTVAAGRSNKEAARDLFISTKTVEAHLQAIYRKLGVASRTQLVALCLS